MTTDQQDPDIDRTILPIDRTPNPTEINVNGNDSRPDWKPLITAPKDAPNVIVIMLDDVGFGSTSTFGGPIKTPTLDKLAEEGLKYTRFHTTSMCAPTRASLLTGMSQHNARFGSIIEYATGYPGYCTEIPASCATIGKILKYNGYATSWFGKNHNVPQWEGVAGYNNDHWPNNMGFEKFYGFIGADSDQYHPLMFDNFHPVQPYEGKTTDEYHMDNDLAEKAIEYLKRHKSVAPDKPFFMHYAPGATHAPHHVYDNFIQMYEEENLEESDFNFSEGLDKLREHTLEKQKSMNICDPSTLLTEIPDGLIRWNDLENDHKEVYARMARIYAGYLTMADSNIGKVLQAVKDLEYEENTLVIYIAGDNGGSAEGTNKGTTNQTAAVANGIFETFDYIKENAADLGGEMHYNHMPAEWAWGLNSPMKWAKRYASHFGGTRNGMVMKFPNCIKEYERNLCPKGLRSQFHHVMDIVPTILDIANIPVPKIVDGVEQLGMDGTSMVYSWSSLGELDDRKPALFELMGNRGLYHEGMMWCTTPQVISWDPKTQQKEGLQATDFDDELYNVSEDFSQGDDLVKKHPEGSEGYQQVVDKVKELKDMFNCLAEENNVYPMSYTSSDLRHGQVGMPLLTPGRTLFRYYDGTTRIPEYCAPDLADSSFNIEARFKTPTEGPIEGAIISLGGRFGGWGLVIINGKANFVYKVAQWDGSWWKVEAPETGLESGVDYVARVHFEIDPEPAESEEQTEPTDRGGDFSLSIRKVVEGVELPDAIHPPNCERASITPTAVFTECETLEVGCDYGTPLLEAYKEQMPFKFTGELYWVEVEVLNNSSIERKKKIHKAKLMARLSTD